MWKELFVTSTLGISTVIGVSCGEDKTSYQNVVAPEKVDSTSVEELRGEDFRISRLGVNVFKVSGVKKEDAIRYLSEQCNILSVGAWNTDNTWTSRINEHAVTVADGECLPELE